MLKLNELEPTLRRRIQAQIEQEDAARKWPAGQWTEQDAKNAKSLAGRLHTQKPESDRRGEGEDSALAQGAALPRYRITFTVYRKRLLDRFDNERAALKPLCDAITILLGFSNDECPELEWRCHQVKSQTKGTHVLIEQL